MDTVYLNGQFINSDQAKISPDDRGFLLSDGIYEVVRWYGGYFLDLEGHTARLRRSLKETRIEWEENGLFGELSTELIHRNGLGGECAIVYFQVTRGAAPRTHAFPSPPVKPTVYGFARRQSIDTLACERGVAIWLVADPRWARCDIKSTALLANILPYQEAHDRGFAEVCFVRNGFVTEGAHSNIFFVRDGALYTHPESNEILSGITRKIIIGIAAEHGIPVVEEAVASDMIPYMHEAFICNTTGEVVPVLKISDQVIGEGSPGTVTRRVLALFRDKVQAENPVR